MADPLTVSLGLGLAGTVMQNIIVISIATLVEVPRA